jgi:transglutaminase-like putative cysteine protease
LEAAASIKSFIDSNDRLPNFVQIDSKQVLMSEMLRIMSVSVLQLDTGIKTPVLLRNVNSPVGPIGDNVNGQINKTEFVNIAQRIKSFIDSNGISPNYITSSLGRIQYESTIYMMAKVLNFYKANSRLPSYVTVESCKVNSDTIPEDLQKYLNPTKNCQSDDPKIKALAYSLTNGVSSTYDKGVKIFNWVRDNLAYSFYYNTKYGAVNTYLNKQGNCVDHSHLLIALARAAEIPARYMHGTCTFTSGNVYGHVWAQLYINGKWYDADAISSKNSLGSINNWNKNTVIMKGTYSELPF